MRSKVGSFFLGFFITSLVLLPLVGLFLHLSAKQEEARLTAESQVSIRVEPGAQNIFTLLLAAAGEEPDLLLIRLDCPANVISLAVVPRQSVLLTPDGTATAAQCYAAAGPARVAALLGDTLGYSVSCYLAAVPSVYDALLDDQPFRVNLSGYLSAKDCKTLDLDSPLCTLTAVQAAALGKEKGLRPDLEAALSMALWESAIRQNLERAPQLVEALRRQSGRLLTNLTALDLSRLEATLNYLSSRQPRIEYQVLPGRFVAGRYEFNNDTLTAAKALLD